MEQLTVAHCRILAHDFESTRCPVCTKSKQRRWCFCRTCYFALKTARPKLASGLWREVSDGTDEFFENYRAAKVWLSSTGLQKLKNDQGGLFV